MTNTGLENLFIRCNKTIRKEGMAVYSRTRF